MMSYELLSQLKDAVSHLPVDKFVTVEADGGCYVDWNKTDAADFIDNAQAFAKTMCMVKALQLNDNYNRQDT